MKRALKDKICPTCANRFPAVVAHKLSTVPHSTPVTDCILHNDIESIGVCPAYHNLWTNRQGIFGKPPEGRPTI